MKKPLNLLMLITIAALSLTAVSLMTTPAFAQDEQPPQPEEIPAEVVVDSPPSELAPALEAVSQAGVTLADGNGEPLALATDEAAEALAGSDPYYKVGTVTYHFIKTGTGDCSAYPVGTCWISDTPIERAIQEIPNTGLPSDGLIYVEGGTYIDIPNISGLANPIYRGVKGLIGEVSNGLPLVILGNDIMVDNVDLGFTIKGFNITANIGPTSGIWMDSTKGTIKIEDTIVVNNGTGPGISISNHNGAIVLNRVKADGNLNGGAWLENLAGTAGVTITNSSFDDNDISSLMSLQGVTISTNGAVLIDGVSVSRSTGATYPALNIIQFGAVTIKNSLFNDNDFFGIGNYLPASLTATITLQNVYANGNAAGLHLQAKGNISLTALHADENSSKGAEIDTCNEDANACTSLGSGNVTIKDSTFDGNGSSLFSLWVQSRGAITLTNVSASGTSNAVTNPDGAQLDNHYSQLVKPVTITNGLFNANDGTGLVITSKGAITLNKVHAGDAVAMPYLARGNGGGGAYLDNTYGTAGVTISGSASGDNSFSHNGGAGLDIWSKGSVSIKFADAYENGFEGLMVHNDGGTGAVNISKGNYGLIFQENTSDAIAIYSKGNVTVSDVKGISINSHGLYVSLAAESSGSVTLTNSEFTYCGANGIYVLGRGNITLTKVKANYNESWGAVLQANTGNITIKGGDFSGNNQSGLIASTKGAITLTDVSAIDNMGEGANLDNKDAVTPKAVTITNGNFIYNNWSGLKVQSKGAITLKNVNATNNNYKTPVNMGSDIGTYTSEVVEPYGEDTFMFNLASSGTLLVSIKTVGFYGEMWMEGCNADFSHFIATDAYLSHSYNSLTPGTCILHVKDTYDETGGAYSVLFGGTYYENIAPIAYGAFLDNHTGTAGITITNPALPAGEPYAIGIGFSMNAAGGLELRTNGAITLTNIWAGRNAGNGVDIQNHETAAPYTYAAKVTTTNFRAWDNYGNGIYVESKSAISLTNAASTGNLGNGAYLSNSMGSGNITIKNNPSTDTNLLPGFDNNIGTGVVSYTNGSVSLTNPNLIGNVYSAVYSVSNGPGTVTLTNCRAQRLLTSYSIVGLSISANGPVVVNGGYTQGFTNTGLEINNSGGTGKPVTISNFKAMWNKTSGVTVQSTGAITLYNVAGFGTTTGAGLVLDNSASTAGITLSFVEASHNEGTGIDLKTQGAVSFKTGNILHNTANGVQVNSAGTLLCKALVMSDLNIYNNAGYGFIAQYVNGAITATNINSSNSLAQGGVVLENTACANCPVSFLTTGTKTNDIHSNHGTGLHITTNGAVTLNKILADYNNPGYGVYIDNAPASSTATKVTINNSEFKGNANNGMYIVTTGVITLNTVESSDNGSFTFLSNAPDDSGAKGVTVLKSKFNRNTGDGLQISTHGAVVLNKIEATGNKTGGKGIWINNNGIPVLTKPVSILSSYGANLISANDSSNLVIETSGAVVLSGITADSSTTGSGISVDNTSGIGTVTLTTITTRYNHYSGVAILTHGSVTIKGLNSLFNSAGSIPDRWYNGLLINTFGFASAKVTISSSLVSGNADHGINLILAPGGLYTLTTTYYFGNATEGDGGLNLWVH